MVCISIAQSRPFPMDLHRSWGGPFAVGKKILFSTQSNKKSVNLGTLPVFDFVTKHPAKNIPIYYFPTSFDFSSSYYLAFLNTIWKGESPFSVMKPCITALYVRLQPNFPKWFESVLLNPDHCPWISTIRRGGALCGRKKIYFSVHKVMRNRSIWRPCQFLIFVTKHHVKTFFVFPHPTILRPWIRSERGNLPFLWWNPVSPPYSMYVRLQPNFPKWFESALPNLDQFPWISTIRGGDPLR